MALLNRIFRTRQDELHEPSYINEIASTLARSLSADSDNALRDLAHRPPALPAPTRLAASPRKRIPRARSTASSGQLNVRLSPERQAAIRRFARRERLTLSEAVGRAIDLLTAPQ